MIDGDDAAFTAVLKLTKAVVSLRAVMFKLRLQQEQPSLKIEDEEFEQAWEQSNVAIMEALEHLEKWADALRS